MFTGTDHGGEYIDNAEDMRNMISEGVMDSKGKLCKLSSDQELIAMQVINQAENYEQQKARFEELQNRLDGMEKKLTEVSCSTGVSWLTVTALVASVVSICISCAVIFLK